MSVKSKTRRAYRRKQRMGAWGIILIVLAVFGVSTIGGIQLKQKNAAYQVRIEALMAEIEQEKERAEELVELEAYTKTKKCVEDIARERLNLVYEDEILFKSKE